MNSIWPSALASLDQSVAPFDAILEKLEAALPIEVSEVTRQLKAADENCRKLRAMLLAELPEAEWNDREELGVLIAKRDIELQRSRLRALAEELQRGSIVHRRAARVQQLSELRDHAIKELRSFADQPTAPPTLPGPGAEHWVEWACSLKEPDDAEALRGLRNGFLYLDEFVASVEPGMWTVEGRAPAQAEPASVAGDTEGRGSRLLALASELEHGNVVHHRGIRVTQVNQLRKNAVEELRSLAELNNAAPTLPGPEASQWVLWASSLKEPDDAVPLRALRNGFVHLDEFVANLEPEMWAPAGAGAAAKVPEPQPVSHSAPLQPAAHVASAEETHAQPELAEAIQTLRESGEDEASTSAGWLAELWAGKRNIIIATAAVLIIAVLGAVRWTVHHTNANSVPVKAIEASAPSAAPVAAMETSTQQPAVTTASLKESAPAKPKTEDAAPKPAPAAPAEKQPQLLAGATLKTPEAMPKQAAKADDAAPPTLTALAGPGSGMPGNVMNIVKTVPTAPAKVKASSGVAEGQLIHRVTPAYPQQARLSGIQGTVSLQALIGKDGKVQNVKVLKGPAMLTQAAVDAVKQWQYKPFLLNGEPAEADVQINLNFTP
jgi:protein TonB